VVYQFATHSPKIVVQTYGWDEVNRLVDFNSSWTYTYRADGLRTQKYLGTSNYTNFRYEGQMPIQTEGKTSGTQSYSDNGLGARGIDITLQYGSTGSYTGTTFPIYDGHGNQAASLARSGSSYALSNQRTYDAWGVIRSGSTSGAPGGRHSANLGHLGDDETGFIYMRARYYDAPRGRFINEDSSREGANWYLYCGNDPIDKLDATGHYSVPAANIWVALGFLFAGLSAFSLGKVDWGYIGVVQTGAWVTISGGAATIAVACFTFSQFAAGGSINQDLVTKVGVAMAVFAGTLAIMSAAARIGVKASGVAMGVVMASYVYGLVLLSELVAQDVEAMS
jgi:RHS repeat-associated protein